MTAPVTVEQVVEWVQQFQCRDDDPDYEYFDYVKCVAALMPLLRACETAAEWDFEAVRNACNRRHGNAAHLLYKDVAALRAELAKIAQGAK